MATCATTGCGTMTWCVPACAKGHAVLAINLEPVFASIDDYAAQVQAAVAALRQHWEQPRWPGGPQHGGLAIRAWMRTYGWHQACRVLTLGTPHQGTRIQPGTSGSPNGRQMQWHSPGCTHWRQAKTPAHAH